MTVNILNNLLNIATKYPNAIAVESELEKISYQDLVCKIKTYAHQFQLIKNKPKILIALNRCSDAYAAMFASLMINGLYCPINLELPESRLRKIVTSFKPDIIISNFNTFEVLTHDFKSSHLLNPLNLNENLISNLEVDFAQSEQAYVIYTSGTTGEPKGVKISYAALANYISWMLKTFINGPNERWGQYANLGFDASVTDIYGALCSGGTLVPITSSIHRLMPAKAIEDFQLTIWNSVPSVVNLMKGYNASLSSLKFINLIGEPLLSESVKFLFSKNSALSLQNSYGPTEATVACTYIILNKYNYKQYIYKSTMALGKPTYNMNIKLYGGSDLNEGEIIISGLQLACEYVGDKTTTANHFKTIDGVRYYFTGDWAVIHNNQMFFSHRIDEQIKINGYRLELTSVTCALMDSNLISDAATIIYNDKIHCFVTTKNINLDVENRLLSYLKGKIEPYAIPSYINVINEIPKNHNGKVNKQALEVFINKQDDYEFKAS